MDKFKCGGGGAVRDALSDVLIGNNSIYIGDIPESTVGSERNTTVGTEVLGSNGDDNVAIGYQAGNSVNSGSFNTFIGSVLVLWVIMRLLLK